MTTIIYSFLVLAGLGLLFGLLLAFASKKFAVEVDPRVSKIRDALPGANCGACGFPGCDGLANAIVEGTAPANACPVGGAKAASMISNVMGVDAGDLDQKIAFVRCNGSLGNTKTVYDYDGMHDCAGAASFAGGPKACRFACIGLGNCVRACKFDAIHVENEKAVIDSEKCVGCGACAKACPKQVIAMMNAKLPVLVACRNSDLGKRVKDVCTRGCLSCKKCERNCEAGAIIIQGNVPVIDYAKCTKCGKCADNCPTKCLAKFDEYCSVLEKVEA